MTSQNSIFFEKGYPKRIFYKHYQDIRLYKDIKGSIIGFFPKRLCFWIYVNNSYEENELLKK